MWNWIYANPLKALVIFLLMEAAWFLLVPSSNPFNAATLAGETKMDKRLQRYKAKEAIIEAVEAQQPGVLATILDGYKASDAVKMVLEILTDNEAGPSAEEILEALNQF